MGKRKIDRSDPRKNKSLAIRMVLKKMPSAKAKEVAEAVKMEFGHKVGQNMVYMVKTKTNMASDGRPKRTRTSSRDTPMTTPALWIDRHQLVANCCERRAASRTPPHC